MDESAMKGKERNGSLNMIASKICVKGYPTCLGEDDLKLALREHFASCGEITHVNVPRDFERGILKSRAYMRIWGEDVEEKALRLSGRDMGGWTVIASKASPFDDEYTDSGRTTVEAPQHQMFVTGYDTSLREIDIIIGLVKYFRSCGEVCDVLVPGDGSGGINGFAVMSIEGEDALEKARALSGSEVDGWKIHVRVMPENPQTKADKQYGYTLPKKVLARARARARMMSKV